MRNQIVDILTGTVFIALLLSCSASNPDEPEETFGTIQVSIDGVRTEATWHLEGPDTDYDGEGDEVLLGMPTGTYALTWGGLEGYDSPTPNPTAGTLNEGQILEFHGSYLRQVGTVQVDVGPGDLEAPWYLDGPDADYSGDGDDVLADMPIGTYTMTWGDLLGYDSPQPNPTADVLEKGALLDFLGVYTPQLGTIEVDTEPDDIGASWHLDGPNISFDGFGDESFDDMPTGSYSISWGALAGWEEPDSEEEDLVDDGVLVFAGRYTRSGFVRLYAGSFTMGAPGDELGTDTDERPQHDVYLTRAFYIQQTEVTNQEYLQMAQWAYDNGYATATSTTLQDGMGAAEELLDLDDGDCEIQFSAGTFSLRNAGHGINPDHPVQEVTWYGAAAYCDWQNLQEELALSYDHSTWQCNGGDPHSAEGYRLPTEAEWEYACRSGSTSAFANGSIVQTGCGFEPNLSLIGWYCGNDTGWSSSVSTKIPNAWGLYDMHGNLFEWVNDWYSSSYYASSPYLNPPGPSSGSNRVIRGGGWDDGAQLSRSADRYSNAPTFTYYDVGFRVVRSD